MSKGKVDDDTLKEVQDLIKDKTSSVEQLATGAATGGALGNAGEKLNELFKNAPGAQEVRISFLFPSHRRIERTIAVTTDNGENTTPL